LTSPDDPTDDMPRLPAHDAERVFAERTDPDELSGDDALLAGLFASMRGAAEVEPERDSRMIASIAAEVRAGGADLHAARSSRSRRRHRVSAKAATIAFAAVLASGTAAAAATGSLPDPVQRAVASALSHVNITVPHPNHHGATSDARTTSRDGGASGPGHAVAGSVARNAVGPDATGSAEAGLCTAWERQVGSANGRAAKSVAFSNLQDAAAAAGKTVPDFCDGIAHEPGGSKAPTTTTGPVGATTTTDGTHATKRQNGAHGPPVTTPDGTGKPAFGPGPATTSTTPHGDRTVANTQRP